MSLSQLFTFEFKRLFILHNNSSTNWRFPATAWYYQCAIPQNYFSAPRVTTILLQRAALQVTTIQSFLQQRHRAALVLPHGGIGVYGLTRWKVMVPRNDYEVICLLAKHIRHINDEKYENKWEQRCWRMKEIHGCVESGCTQQRSAWESREVTVVDVIRIIA